MAARSLGAAGLGVAHEPGHSTPTPTPIPTTSPPIPSPPIPIPSTPMPIPSPPWRHHLRRRLGWILMEYVKFTTKCRGVRGPHLATGCFRIPVLVLG